MKTKKSSLRLPKIIFNWKRKDNTASSAILINGILITCVLLSIASGFIDLTFFSGLSKSLFHVGTIPVPAAVLYSIISIGFISGKFWCAMQIGMLKELQTRLEAKGKTWATNLKKARIPWHIAHKFLIAVSIITTLSLSVNSIGSALKDTERNTTNITITINRLQNIESEKKENLNGKAEAIKSSSKNAIANEEAAQADITRAIDKLHEYQDKRDEIRGSDAEDKDEQLKILKTEYNNLIPGVTASDIDFADRSTITQAIMKRYESSSISNKNVDNYETLVNENTEEIKNTIIALNELYKHPNEYKDGRLIEGKKVSFLDENGEPIDITQVIGILQGLREEWKSNTDIGESSQVFMLISEAIVSKSGEETSSDSGIAELMMMVLIALFGIVQEFLIYLFTPKATIDRKLLSQVSHYMKWESEQEKEKFLIDVYISYVGDGVISQEQFEAKCEKAVYFMEMTSDDVISKYSHKKRMAAQQLKVNNKKIDDKVAFLPTIGNKVKLDKEKAKLTEERDSDLQKLIDKAKGLL